jgi:ketosteroid isomerase-like protein
MKYSGWAEYEQGFQQVASTWKSIKINLGDFQATRNGNIAWAVYTTPFEIEPKEGAVMKATTRNTDIFEKRGEDWIIVHEHVSAPLEPPPPPTGAAKKK